MISHLTSKELAQRLRVRVDTINHWRTKGIGPVWIKLGNSRSSRVVYRLQDIESWEQFQIEGYP